MLCNGIAFATSFFQESLEQSEKLGQKKRATEVEAIMDKINQPSSERLTEPKRITFVTNEPNIKSHEEFVAWLDCELTELEKAFSGFSSATNQWRPNKRK